MINAIKPKSGNKATRLLSLLLACLLLTALLSSCRSAPIKSSEEATQSVGNVGGYEVPYEELYFLASSYKLSLESRYGEYSSLTEAQAREFEDELRRTVYSNITANYAILTLCADSGLTPDAETDERVQSYIDSLIESDFDGSRGDYKKWLKEYGLTDNYLRFTARVDLLYSDLMTKYLADGVISDDDAYISDKIENEFVRTWHIMIANDAGDDISANRAKAEEALAKLRDGSADMYTLIGSSYNEDFTLTTLDGYYFTRGSMDESYENAAFSLDINGISDVVEGYGENASGDRVSCFYIIQRLELDEDYVNLNFQTLKKAYQDAVMSSMLESTKSDLEFIPNEFGASLALSTAEAPKAYVPVVGIVISVSCGVVLCGTAAFLTVMLVRKRKKAKRLSAQNKPVQKKKQK